MEKKERGKSQLAFLQRKTMNCSEDESSFNFSKKKSKRRNIYKKESQHKESGGITVLCDFPWLVRKCKKK